MSDLSFKVSARTILHLGSELISSDGIAFYELIKNSLDAEADQITVEITYRLRYETYAEIMGELGEDRDAPRLRGSLSPSAEEDSQEAWRRSVPKAVKGLVAGAPEVEELKRRVEGAKTRKEFIRTLRSANRIEIDDDGQGMSMDILRRVYLTIGTAHRADEKLKRGTSAAGKDPKRKVILGEKGLGRLSAMRLGDHLLIVTGEKGAKTWNQLEIDWNAFAEAADQDISTVKVRPVIGNPKDGREHGTLIRATALRGEWSEEKLQDLAAEHFSRLVDPFDGDTHLPLKLVFNGSEVQVPAFAKFLLEHAHGRLQVAVVPTADGSPAIEGSMEYRLHDRTRALRLTPLELHTLTGADAATLRRAGPFDLELYWFNRRILTKIEGIGNLAVVRRLLSEWAGGLSLYRDGFRVNPYGSPNDDWLDLDRDAFSTSGFKLNRGQIIGRVRISQDSNPYLVDQTNREGLKDNPEKRAFVGMLSSVVEIYRQFLNEIDRDVDRARRVTAAEALDRFRAEDERIGSLVPMLEAALKPTENGKDLAKRLRSTLSELRAAAEQVQRAAGAQEQERSRVLHLASIGLMIEILAHELYRATAAGLDTIAQARRSRDPAATGTSLRVLDSQLRTLQKRLKVLDPLSTNARQTKETFDLVSWVSDIVGGFASRNEQSGLTITVDVSPPGSALRITAVKGMFVQILENLLTNSLYWVSAQHRERVRLGIAEENDRPIGTISVSVDTAAGRVVVTDDGPGIPEERRDTVFEPFFSTKPQKQGRGLGLYIAREIAEYHGGTLTLGQADRDRQIHSVILDIGKVNAKVDP